MGIFGNKKNIIIITGVTWFLYSFWVTQFGECGFYLEEYDDGWYLMDTFEDEDNVSYDTKIDGPFDKKTAEDYMVECRKKALRFKKTYGTIYNLIPEHTDVYGIENKNFNYYIGLIMVLTFMYLPLYFLYKLYKKLP